MDKKCNLLRTITALFALCIFVLYSFEAQAKHKKHKKHEYRSSQEISQNLSNEEQDPVATIVSNFGSSIIVPSLPAQTNAEITKLTQEAEESVSKLHADIAHKESLITKKTEKKLQAIHENVEEKIAQMRDQTEQITSDLRKNIQIESFKLKKEAAVKTLDIIQDAQERALQLKNKAQREAIAKQFGQSDEPETQELDESIDTDYKYKQAPIMGLSRHETKIHQDRQNNIQSMSPDMQNVSPEWKNEMSKQFYQNITFIKNIILSAETPQEREDYLKRFSDQNLWFDNTLRSTHQTSDAGYAQIANKHAILQKIVSAQKTADNYLAKMSKTVKLTPDLQKKTRLAALYEINALIQDPIFQNRNIPSDQITALVRKKLGEFSVIFRQRANILPDVIIEQHATKPTQVVHLKVEKLEQEVGHIKQKLDKTKQGLAQTKKNLQEKITEQLEAELATKQALEQAEQIKAQNKAAHKQIQKDYIIKQDLNTQLEGSTKTSLDLETVLTLTQQDLKATKIKAQKAEKMAQESEQRAQMVESLAQQTIDSITKYLEEEKKSIKQEKVTLLEKEIELQKTTSTLLDDRQKLITDRNQLLQERELLEEIKKETHKITAQSKTINATLQSELLALQQQAEKELLIIRDNTKQELDLAHKQLQNIQQKKNFELNDTQKQFQQLKQEATTKLQNIHAKTKIALEQKNLAKIKGQLNARKATNAQEDEEEEEGKIANFPVEMPLAK
ncbi:MAG: hypothetical protein ABH827_07055 [bacterium]